MADQSPLRFDAFEIDLQAIELRRNGTRMPLGPQPVRVLAILVERAGTLVTREDLYRALWPDGEVDMNRALNTCVRQIRIALRPYAGRAGYIQTYPRRGYRFVVPHRESSVEQPRSSRTPMLAAATGIALAVLATGWWIRSQWQERPLALAVLPFDTGPNDADTELLARGLSEGVLTTLASIDPGRLHVMGWTVPAPAGQEIDIARDLYRADYAVTGSLTAESAGVVVRARLVRTRDGAVVWTDSYRQPALDVVLVEREIVGRVVGALLPRLQAGTLHARQVPRPEVRLEWLKGAYLLSSQDVARRPEAAPHFLRVLALDSAFAPASAGLAEAYFWGNRPSEARIAVSQALSFDPNEPHALFVRSNLRLMSDWDWKGAERDARRAIALRPGRPEYHQNLAFVLSTAGRSAEATRELRLALTLDPVSPAITADLGLTYFWAGQFEEAAKLCRQTVELDPSSALGHDCAFAAFAQSGRWSDAAFHAARLVQLYGRSPDEVMGTAGDVDRVRRYRRWKAQLFANAYAKGRVSPFWLAVVQADAGQFDQALVSLEKAARERAMGYVAVRVDARFAGLRSYPRFAALVHELDTAKTSDNAQRIF